MTMSKSDERWLACLDRAVHIVPHGSETEDVIECARIETAG